MEETRLLSLLKEKQVDLKLMSASGIKTADTYNLRFNLMHNCRQNNKLFEWEFREIKNWLVKE